ncbi:MAG TPA: tetratricopeptide repeat protein [Candidatus Angelobacter sp.]|nr:tetratricopeptide repeat protein [Candidatus Angelobacter sp.]
MGGSTAPELTYPVPWHMQSPQDPPATGVLVVYWFPASAEELKQSSLRMSRTLSLYASQCVAMDVADVRSPAGVKFAADAKLPVVVLTTADGTIVGKAENNNGFLRVGQVEKLVDDEVKQRQSAIDEKLKNAKDRAKSGDKDAAIPLYRAVLEQKCLFPKKAKDAAKELKKLGVNDVGEILEKPDFASPNFDVRMSARMIRTLRTGIDAEMRGDYPGSEKFYAAAHRMDPADPTPMRYLGELYRHETGEWDKARSMFNAILAMPADPIARAVALHGLGKITIHEGDFAKGRELMESSVKTYPLALAYRNLAVYWNSEGDSAKTADYVQKALALEPADPFNLTFAAAFMAGNGHAEEALKIAAENQSLLPASYNLAAIYAQTGQREKALALLKRHFFEYERYDAVRSKEMMEARVDAVFLSLRDDPVFVALTSGADGKLDPSRPMPTRAGAAN